MARTLLHLGVLFLDELAEFDRDVLDALRQPLEDGTVEIVRASGSARYPARVQLVAACNPCRCGWYGDATRPCRCPTGEPDRYARRISGPLLDRIDLQVHMPRVGPSELIASTPSESSRDARVRIERALARSRARNGGLSNARLPGSSVMDACMLTAAGASRLRDIATSEGMSARAIHRVLRVARTIADLAEATGVDESHVIAALSLREDALTRRLAA